MTSNWQNNHPLAQRKRQESQGRPWLFCFSWEQRKVSDVANRYDNLRIPVAANLRVPGTTPYYGANGIQDYVDGFTHEGEFILVAEDGANDLKNYPVKCVHGRIWVNNHAHVLQSKPEMADNKFLAYSIGQADIEALLVGGGRAKLNAEVMMSIELVVPSISEQIAIGRYLTRLDDLITLHQRCAFPLSLTIYIYAISWEQRKLGEAFDFLQNNTLSRADLTADTGVAKNVHYGDVLIKFGEYLDASSSDLPYIPSRQIVDKFKASLLQDGDVIMADTAEDEAVGKCTEIAGLQGFPTISGLHTIPLRPKEKFAPGYLGYYMNSCSYHDQLLPLMQGIKVTSVSKGAILNTDISYPADSNEQAEIGGFFIQLDNLITLHQRG